MRGDLRTLSTGKGPAVIIGKEEMGYRLRYQGIFSADMCRASRWATFEEREAWPQVNTEPDLLIDEGSSKIGFVDICKQPKPDPRDGGHDHGDVAASTVGFTEQATNRLENQ